MKPCIDSRMTLEEARKMSNEYPYAVVNVRTGKPICLCEDKESADMTFDEMWRCCYTTPLVVDLRKEQNYESNVKSANGRKDRRRNSRNKRKSDQGT